MTGKMTGRKLTALLLALTLLVSLCSVTALAETTQTAGAPAPVVTQLSDTADIDEYGNVMLDLTIADFEAAGYAVGDIVTVSFGATTLTMPVCTSYSQVDSGTPTLLLKSGKTQAELVINGDSFAEYYGIAEETTTDGDGSWTAAEGVTLPLTFTISMQKQKGYLYDFRMRSMEYTNNRSDYANLTDEEFANFRVVSTTGMGKNILYRTASPIDGQFGRNTCADAAIEKAGVTVVMDLADTAKEQTAFDGYETTYYSTTKSIALGLSISYHSDRFRAGLAEGLRFFAENPGVYAVHCIEGKERTGYVISLLECFMGASLDEVLADSMITYYNYYGVTADDEAYDLIAGANVLKNLQIAFGTEDLAGADLAACAETFFKGLGLTDEEIAALRTNLSADRSAEPEADTAEPEAEPAPSEDTPAAAEEPDTHGHVYIRGWRAPTAEEPGYTGDRYCLICGRLLEKGYEYDWQQAARITDPILRMLLEERAG